MTTIEYMQRQVEKHTRNLAFASSRSGVTEKELNDIQLKIKYYEEAVRALNKE